MPAIDRLQTRVMGGSFSAPAATSGTSAQYPTGPKTYDPVANTYGSAVDEIDLGAGSGIAPLQPGSGLHRPLYLHVALSAVTGTGTLTLDIAVMVDSDTAFGTESLRFSTPQISSVQNSALNTYKVYALPYIPYRYARIRLTPGGTTPAWTGKYAISDSGDTRFVA